ncbi:MAG: WecB/TagA/CpsF family glycosyltransferase, partial [Paracoccaceae bacterium]
MPDGSTTMTDNTQDLKPVPMLNAFVHDLDMDDLVKNFTEGMMLTLHVDMIMKLQQDQEFYDILDQFDVVTCDSQIMYFATKFLGTPVRQRVSGSDYFPKFYMHHKDNPDMTLFMMGGKPGVAELAAS